MAGLTAKGNGYLNRLELIKTKIERAKIYGVDMNVTMAEVEWLIGHAERLEGKIGELDPSERSNYGA